MDKLAIRGRFAPARLRLKPTTEVQMLRGSSWLQSQQTESPHRAGAYHDAQSSAQSLHHPFIAASVLWRTVENDLASIDHIEPVADTGRGRKMRLRHQDGDTHRFDLHDGFRESIDHDRRQSLKRLVEQEQRR